MTFKDPFQNKLFYGSIISCEKLEEHSQKVSLLIFLLLYSLTSTHSWPLRPDVMLCLQSFPEVMMAVLLEVVGTSRCVTVGCWGLVYCSCAQSLQLWGWYSSMRQRERAAALHHTQDSLPKTHQPWTSFREKNQSLCAQEEISLMGYQRRLFLLHRLTSSWFPPDSSWSSVLSCSWVV